MNVLHVILTLERAGAQEVVRTLVEQLDGRCRSVVATFVDGDVRGDLEAMGVAVEVLGGREHGIEALPKFLAEQRSIRQRLSEIVQRYEIDIVQTYILHTLDFLVLSLRRVAPVKAVVWNVQNSDFLPAGARGWPRLKRKAHAWLYRANAKKFGAIVACGEEVHRALVAELGPMAGKITTIANAVDTARLRQPVDRGELLRELELPQDCELLLTVGRLTEQKGQTYLLQAMPAVLAARPNAHLLIVGEGELLDPLRDEVRRLDVADRVRFLGLRTDVPRLLAGADVFVLPSLWEGLSLALLEAMASGTPVVATAVAGTTEAIVDGETGFVVPPRDAAALAEAISRALSDRDSATAIGERAYHAVEQKFSARAQADTYFELFQRLVHPS